MSTRCQIQVKGSQCLIYKHCDGYPEGVMPFLETFTKSFVQNRGNDPDYFIAQYLRHLAVEEIKDEWRHNTLDYLGYGVDTTIHGDIEYFYTVDLETGNIHTKTYH